MTKPQLLKLQSDKQNTNKIEKPQFQLTKPEATSYNTKVSQQTDKTRSRKHQTQNKQRPQTICVCVVFLLRCGI